MTVDNARTPAPEGLRESGRALWHALMADYDLGEHETTVLREACRTADSLDDLQQLLEVEGLMSSTSQGPRIHPALVELRQQRMTFARLLTALRIPDEDTTRAPARPGTRGVYGLRGA